ncbi:MAG TPA: ABC transporter permease, partial [Thermoanaerobaculia bacterium]|nr:ABC transporter permease [Thermoanaerobaculia bacterium]
MLGKAFRAVRNLMQKGRVERELESELRFHLDMEIEQLVRGGMSLDEARRTAYVRFGGVERFKEEHREARGGRFVETVAQDVRYGLRSLLRTPAFSLAVIVTLALGIGANTAIFSVVRGVLIRPLPYAQGDRLVVLRQSAPRAEIENAGFSVPEIADYRERSHTLSGLVEYHSMFFNLLGHGNPERVQTGVVSANFFDVLGTKPLLGRAFLPGEDRPGAAPVLVLSYEYWRRSHRGDPKIVGQTFEMNDRIHTVVGVLPPVPQYPDENDVYMPVSSCPSRASERVVHGRTMRMVEAFGRLAPGATLASARSEMAEIAQRMVAEHPEDYPKNGGFQSTALSLEDELTRVARPRLLVLFATAGFVLLLVCANVANLSLARTLRRDRELAVRTALGAGRGRLVRQLLTESTLLSLAGGGLGLLLAWGGLDLLIAFVARSTPRAREIGIDGTVLLFTLAVSLLTGLAGAALPALTRKALFAALKEGGERATAGAHGLRVRSLLVGAQVAISFVLLTGAGLLLRSLFELERVNPGFRSENVLAAEIDLDWSRYNEEEPIRRFQHALLDRVHGWPGVLSAGLGSTFPLNDSQPPSLDLRIEGRPAPEMEAAPRVDYRIASPEYFGTLGMALVRGRTFATADDAKATPVAVINQSMARRFWPSGDPLGQRITMDGGETWRTIVGVVGDVKQYGLAAATKEEVYTPAEQRPPGGMSLLIRTAAAPGRLEQDVRRAVRGLDPKQPVARIRTLEEVRRESLASPRLTAMLLGLFALLALGITAAGIAGVIAFSVSQRTHEIGIRMALGAERGRVLGLILREGLGPVLVGLPLGILGALALARLAAGLLFGVKPTDPRTFLAVGVILAAVAVAACLLPGRRAT